SIMDDIGFEQDPRFQGTVFHMLAEIGGYPSLRSQERIFKQWSTRIRSIASPQGLSALLRAFAAWDIDWAREAAQQVNSDKLAARIHAGAIADLEYSERLISALSRAGGHAAASAVITSLKSIPDLSRRLGLGQTARLVSVLADADSEF